MKKNKIPKFKNEKEERAFWMKHDSSDYLDWSSAKKVLFPNLKPSSRTISLRLSESLLDRLRIEANKRDIPYQSYLKTILDKELS